VVIPSGRLKLPGRQGNSLLKGMDSEAKLMASGPSYKEERDGLSGESALLERRQRWLVIMALYI